ncbi:hypothetical protein [Peribacillus asahii]|uniref:hypothetical protein n=1 Tax=Peribacillus asahii TaxID=228899 RepID=UPI00207A9002|nr:hypothetical protein [Peribacillus asahii]USK68331.1 hypothetical protein LIS76_11870 [Peribacillus asahii]
MLGKFSGKKILFISARFFNYEKEIQKKLESFGAIVDFFDERPGNDFITKSLIRVNRKLLFKKNNDYYNEIINSTKHRNYDIVFIIRGEVISINNMKKLKEHHPKAKFILYMWDALSYSPNSKKVKNLFDHVYTFDKNDSLKYSDMKFRPLFFIDDYKNVANSKTDIDVLFIGTVHTDRYHILKKIEKQLEGSGLSFYFYKYYPSKFLFYLKKIFNSNFRKVKKDEFYFKGLPKKEVLENFTRAKVIVDIERPKQNGLTIRTIEVFGAKKKLLTTNQSINEYDLYNSSNIQVINRDNPVVDINFINQGFKEPTNEIYNKYSIDYWLCEIIGKNVQMEKMQERISNMK